MKGTVTLMVPILCTAQLHDDVLACSLANTTMTLVTRDKACARTCSHVSCEASRVRVKMCWNVHACQCADFVEPSLGDCQDLLLPLLHPCCRALHCWGGDPVLIQLEQMPASPLLILKASQGHGSHAMQSTSSPKLPVLILLQATPKINANLQPRSWKDFTGSMLTCKLWLLGAS